MGPRRQSPAPARGGRRMAVTMSRAEARTEYQRECIEACGLDPAGVEARCFRCGERVVHPAVYWAGWSDTIYLHGACAERLAVALAHDAVEVRLQYGDHRWAAPGQP